MTFRLRTLMDIDLLFLGAHAIEANLLLVWPDSVKLEYPGKIQTQNFATCSIKNVDYI